MAFCGSPDERLTVVPGLAWKDIDLSRWCRHRGSRHWPARLTATIGPGGAPAGGHPLGDSPTTDIVAYTVALSPESVAISYGSAAVNDQGLSTVVSLDTNKDGDEASDARADRTVINGCPVPGAEIPSDLGSRRASHKLGRDFSTLESAFLRWSKGEDFQDSYGCLQD